jgi:hypothetical protein
MVVAGAVVDALKEINVEYPTLDVQKRKELEEAKAKLLAEK